MSSFRWTLLTTLLVGCGARTGLDVPAERDSGQLDVPDAGGYQPLLATDGRHACYRNLAGTLLCWGGSPNGEYASDGGWLSTPTPQPVETHGVPVVVSAHLVGQCVLLTDGTVDCWGYDDEYQRLGDGTGHSQPPPGVPVFTGARDLIGAPHGDFECARDADGRLSCWGYAPDCDPSYPDAGYPATPAARPDLASLSELALGQQALCGILGTTVYCCGWQNSGVLGNGIESLDYHPSLGAVLLPSGSKAVKAAIGGIHACAVLADTTVWCWGWNADGELGDGTKGSNRTTPVQVLGLKDVVQLALGLDHSCARLTDGTARCWGSNTHGQLGDGTTIQRLTPVPVVLPSGTELLADIVDLHAGYDFSCALVASGDVYCWGWNDLGQLGDGTKVDRHAPTKVVGLQ